MSGIDRPEIAVLASGSGTTVEAFVHATQLGIADADVGLVISNNSNSGVFNRINRLNEQYDLKIRMMHVSGKTHSGGLGERGEQTLEESATICALVRNGGFALVALMGYMKKIRGDLLDQYGWIPSNSIYEANMINTHPGPLPETTGLHGMSVQQAVLEAGLGYSAQTLHVVAEDYDNGPIIAEHRVPVMNGDTPETLFAAVQATEKANLPLDVGAFLKAKGQS